MKHTKIVATISDRRCDVDFLKSLYEAGMNAVRINSAHATEESAMKIVTNTRALGGEIAIIIDTKGPEIRLAAMEAEYPKGFAVKTGDKFELRGMQNGSELSNPKTLYVSYPDIVRDLEIGSSILIDDGLMELEVLEKTVDSLICVVKNDGEIAPRKSINLPGVKISLPSITERDRKFIIWAIENDIDFIAHSFVRTREDVTAVKSIIEEYNGTVKVISKIENQEGLDNIDDIIEESYGIMVARGDLGVELAAEHIPVVQRLIVERSIAAKRPVIIATQMLHSMMNSPRPTRAEVSDVASAIYQRADAVMLSGETANGDYPLEAVQTMARIAQEIEQDPRHFAPMLDLNLVSVDKKITAQLSYSAVRACKELGVAAIVTDTMTGRTARYLTAFRARKPIYAVCCFNYVQRRLAISYGVRTMFREPLKDRESLVADTFRELRKRHCLNKSDLAVFVGGDLYPKAGATFLEINTVEALECKRLMSATESFPD